MATFANFSAGYGDALLLGLGAKLREKLKIDNINRCSIPINMATMLQ